MTRGKSNSYPESAKSFCVETGVQKNVMGKEKEEGNASRGLGSSYKRKAPLPFFNLQKAHKSGPSGSKSAGIRCDYDYFQKTKIY